MYLHPHSEPPPPHTIPLGHPSAPAPSTCLMHPTWAGDLFHPLNQLYFNDNKDKLKNKIYLFQWVKKEPIGVLLFWT